MTIGEAMSYYPDISYVKSTDGRVQYDYEKGDVLGSIYYNESDKYIFNHTLGYPDISYERAVSLFRIVKDEIENWGSYDNLKIFNDNDYLYDFDGDRMLRLRIISTNYAGRYALIIDFNNNHTLISQKYDSVSCSNLRLPLSVLRKKFPGMKPYGTSGDMLVYLDGDVSEGVFTKFFIKNKRVVKEQLIVRSDDGFAREWFNSMHDSLRDKGGWASGKWETNHREFDFRNFKIVLSYRSTANYYETILDYVIVLRNN
jgi:hypothetical protein